jgi:hypothetical protein
MSAGYVDHKPGSKPIALDPCGCEQCAPGPGIDFLELHAQSAAWQMRSSSQRARHTQRYAN